MDTNSSFYKWCNTGATAEELRRAESARGRTAATPYIPNMRTLTDAENRLYSPQPDTEAEEKAKRVLLKSLDNLRTFVESDYSVLADTELTDLPAKLQRWNAARAGIAGAFGNE
jgi:hypothetical protein